MHDIAGVPVAYRHRPGDGPTVVLLHGGLSDGRVFDPLVDALDDQTAGVPDAPTADVWTVDRRGHGRTPDTDAPFGFAEMTAELVSFLTEVVGGPAHLVGHSDGASLALVLAIDRPDLVRSVSAFSANTDPSGVGEGTVTVEQLVHWVGPDYAEVAPDGIGHLPEVASKALALWASEPVVPDEDLARIACPVLVAAGENDSIRPEHTRAIAAAIPAAELLLVPAAGHGLVDEDPVPCAEAVLRTVARATA